MSVDELDDHGDDLRRLLHQPVAGALHHGAGYIGRDQLHLIDEEGAGRFLAGQYEERHTELVG